MDANRDNERLLTGAVAMKKFVLPVALAVIAVATFAAVYSFHPTPF